MFYFHPIHKMVGNLTRPYNQMHLTVFVDNFRNISTNSSIYVSVCKGSYGGYVKHKRNDQMCDPSDSQENEKKMQFLFLLLFNLKF